MGIFTRFWDWTKAGMPLGKVGERISKLPVIGKIFAWKPETTLDVVLAGTGVGLLSAVGPTAVVKAIVPAVKIVVPKVVAVIPKVAKTVFVATKPGGGVAILKTGARITAGLVGTGMLLESKKAREFVGEKITDLPSLPGEALSLGEKIGQFIEGEGDVTIGEGFKKAGLVGAGAVLATGLIIGGGKALDKLRDLKKDDVLIPEKAVGKEGEIAPVPDVTTITTGKKKYKKRKMPQPSVNVRVNVVSKPSLRQNNKFINVISM